MSVKYRVRMSNERVVGPFSEQEVIELFEKNHITGDEVCQQFPIGDWKKFDQFPEINSQIEQIKAKRQAELEKVQADTKLTKSQKIKTNNDNTNSEIRAFNEFKFEHGAKVEVDYKELEKKHRLEKLNVPVEDLDDQIEKTVVLNRKKLSENVDKTVVVKQKFEQKKNDEMFHSVDKLIEEQQKEEELAKSRKNLLVRLERSDDKNKSKEELVSEQTQFIDLHEVLPSINAQLKASEIEFEKMAKIQEQEEIHRRKEEEERFIAERSKNLEADEVVVVDKAGKKKIQKKRGMSWIVALAFCAVIYNLMFPDEAPKQVGPVKIKIEFPAANPVEDIPNAKLGLKNGMALYREDTYIKKLLGAYQFVGSLKSKFIDNESLGELVLVYSELLENAESQSVAVNNIYRLIKISEKDLYRNPSAATGAAIFYGKINKPNTGIITIKNYLRIGSKPTLKMLGVYLNLLISAGNLNEAREVYEKIKPLPKKPSDVYISMARFMEINDQLAEAETTIEEGLKYYPNNVSLLLKQANYLVKSKEEKRLAETLQKIVAQNYERSPYYISEYFKYFGMMKALQGKSQEAANNFKKSLNMREDDELRALLAELEVSGNNLSQNLILESKIITFVKKAKEEIKNKNWDQAAINISEAVDADPTNIQAALILADLQLKRGLFEAAIHTLSTVKDKNQNNNLITAELIKINLKAFKLDDAQKLLQESAQSNFGRTSDFYYLKGLLFESKSNAILAMKYYDQALQLNPVDDAILFKQATIYYRNKQFADAKKKLSDALFLDPKNTEYMALYAQIINEQDNADTAIGYLRDLIKEHGEDARLLAAITQIYFKSGQLKEFKYYYQKVQNMPKKDESFYEYLIASARLDESYNEFEQYSLELLKINPGNLKARMNLAEFYIDKNRLNDAIAELKDIKEKLPSYPKVHFMMAKVYIAQGDVKSAKDMAAIELKMNPTMDSSYYIMGEAFRLNREYREAVANFEKAISINSKSVDAMMALGWIKLNQNLSAEALDLFERALKFEPGNPDIHKQMGFAYKALGQRSLAKEKFEDYLKLNPAAGDKPQIDQIIRTLK